MFELTRGNTRSGSRVLTIRHTSPAWQTMSVASAAEVAAMPLHQAATAAPPSSNAAAIKRRRPLTIRWLIIAAPSKLPLVPIGAHDRRICRRARVSATPHHRVFRDPHEVLRRIIDQVG